MLFPMKYPHKITFPHAFPRVFLIFSQSHPPAELSRLPPTPPWVTWSDLDLRKLGNPGQPEERCQQMSQDKSKMM